MAVNVSAGMKLKKHPQRQNYCNMLLCVVLSIYILLLPEILPSFISHSFTGVVNAQVIPPSRTVKLNSESSLTHPATSSSLFAVAVKEKRHFRVGVPSGKEAQIRA